jgi:hypothetical protein
MLAIHTTSLQDCVIRYAGKWDCALVGAASHPHGVLAGLRNQIDAASHPHWVFAGLHNQIYVGSETACSRIC